jgi:hypothetical protein
MFSKTIYIERRKKLQERLKGGLMLFLGNKEAVFHYPGNTYHFRQDSSSLI